MADTEIEWADKVWNPIAGCTVLSPGCTNCYAMRQAARVERMGGAPHYAGLTRETKAGPVWTGTVAVAPDATLTAPLKWRKPQRIFVNSMSDLFHEAVPDEVIDRVFAVMALAPQHTFLVLTKRAERMREYLNRPYSPGQFITILDDGTKIDTPAAKVRARVAMVAMFGSVPAQALNAATEWQDRHYPGGEGFMRCWPLPNVWLGVSVEDQARADERIPHLLATPAAVRWVSAEPLLGSVDLRPWLSEGDGCESCDDGGDYGQPHCRRRGLPAGERCPTSVAVFVNDEGPLDADGTPEWMVPRRVTLDWVVAGGESGPKARPMHPDWARSLRDQCAAAGVPFFFKQWGTWMAVYDRDRDDPDWRRCGETERAYPNGRWLNIAGGHGFHGERVCRVVRSSKSATGRTLDRQIHNSIPADGVMP